MKTESQEGFPAKVSEEYEIIRMEHERLRWGELGGQGAWVHMKGALLGGACGQESGSQCD